MMSKPPMIAAAERASPSGLAQSTIATMNTVSLELISWGALFVAQNEEGNLQGCN